MISNNSAKNIKRRGFFVEQWLFLMAQNLFLFFAREGKLWRFFCGALCKISKYNLLARHSLSLWSPIFLSVHLALQKIWPGKNCSRQKFLISFLVDLISRHTAWYLIVNVVDCGSALISKYKGITTFIPIFLRIGKVIFHDKTFIGPILIEGERIFLKTRRNIITRSPRWQNLKITVHKCQ